MQMLVHHHQVCWLLIFQHRRYSLLLSIQPLSRETGWNSALMTCWPCGFGKELAAGKDLGGAEFFICTSEKVTLKAGIYLECLQAYLLFPLRNIMQCWTRGQWRAEKLSSTHAGVGESLYVLGGCLSVSLLVRLAIAMKKHHSYENS